MPTTGTFAGYAPVQDYLFGLKAKGMKFGIDRMRVLVEALGHPERSYPVIHVAGTNGKGSVAALLDAILHTAGWRTGLYTSPHLVKLGERVQVDRRLLGETEIVAYTNELRPVAERPALVSADDHPSFFEFMTAMAFLQFARRQVDVGIIEVGLGGRLDATNVVRPEVAVITSIGFDHCDMLGDRLDLIAAEKAGEYGQGFAVVASEVKILATQTGKATEEISGQIQAMQTVTQEAVDAIRSIAGTIREINEIAATVAAAVEQQSAATRKIARNVGEAADGTQHVRKNIELVAQVAAESGESAHRVLDASATVADEVRSLGSQVDTLVGRMRAG